MILKTRILEQDQLTNLKRCLSPLHFRPRSQRISARGRLRREGAARWEQKGQRLSGILILGHRSLEQHQGQLETESEFPEDVNSCLLQKQGCGQERKGRGERRGSGHEGKSDSCTLSGEFQPGDVPSPETAVLFFHGSCLEKPRAFVCYYLMALNPSCVQISSHVPQVCTFGDFKNAQYTGYSVRTYRTREKMRKIEVLSLV